MKKQVKAQNHLTVQIDPFGQTKTFSLQPSSFFKPLTKIEKKAGKAQPFLIIGFDTEFQTPVEPVSREVLKGKAAKYEVLSYQFHCVGPNGEAWEGIACPAEGARMSLSEFLVFALSSGVAEGHIERLPTLMYLTGHFTRADVPAFSDFKSLQACLSCIRNTFVSVEHAIPMSLQFGTDAIDLKVRLRDTMLLTPAASKSLAALGDLVGMPKISLSDDPTRERAIKSNMKELRSTDWNLFRRYAMNDAVICATYLDRIAKQAEALTGKHRVPVTLTSIGVDLLLKSWEAADWNKNDLLGMEEVQSDRWNPWRHRYESRLLRVPLAMPHYFEAFVTECYHGGRNEQFWFGPSYEGNWTDFDLAGAYPTAMSLIGRPLWDKMTFGPHSLDEFTDDALGFARVKFSFPDSVRFPTLPVRTANGLVFPRSGLSYCAAPELHLARTLGANLEVLQSVVVPTERSIRIFGEFTKECIAKRKSQPKGSLENLLWKEIANSTYGKTAQGLKPKRVFDMRSEQTKLLPASRITNAYFAAFITSFVRATLGQIMNSLPAGRTVFSCTTDGFLSDATQREVDKACTGNLSQLFGQARQELTGKHEITEVKHVVSQVLGWRTRGQATLKRGEDRKDGIPTLLLARGGIYLRDIDDPEEQNEEIVRMFFNRTPADRILTNFLTGVRDMVEHDADLVPKYGERRLNMEFDWKRKPQAVCADPTYGHVAFSTEPWCQVEDFQRLRELLKEYQHGKGRCLKTVEDYEDLRTYTDAKLSLPVDQTKYLHRREGDVARLRMVLCAAWHKSLAGLRRGEPSTAAAFAGRLEQSGIPCKRSDVEYGREKQFVAGSCPPTERCKTVAASLKRDHFPDLRLEELFPSTVSTALLPPAQRAEGAFAPLALAA